MYSEEELQVDTIVANTDPMKMREMVDALDERDVWKELATLNGHFWTPRQVADFADLSGSWNDTTQEVRVSFGRYVGTGLVLEQKMTYAEMARVAAQRESDSRRHENAVERSTPSAQVV